MVVVLAVAAFVHYDGPAAVLDFARMFLGTPHERYAAKLRLSSVSQDLPAHAWLNSAAASLQNPRSVDAPAHDTLRFRADAPRAAAFVTPLRRGQQFIAEADADDPGRVAIFLDLFRRDGAALRHVGNAARGQLLLAQEIRDDGDYVLRVQPELGVDLALTLVQRVEPTLRVPVEGATTEQIRSSFGAPRDEGRREHEGVDIFAPRGTHVVAAADGIVSSVGTNRLGGNVVWVARPLRREAHYYAHLEAQVVRAGTRVKTGDTLGTVGNTGNARTTAPHLHFGIYAAGGAVDPLPYLIGSLAARPHSGVSAMDDQPSVNATPAIVFGSGYVARRIMRPVLGDPMHRSSAAPGTVREWP